MSTGSPNQPAGAVPQRELPRHYRLAAFGAAVLLLAGGFVGALRTPGVLGMIGYGVSAVVAFAAGVALYLATRRNRGYQSTQTTSLAAGLYVLLGLVDVAMIVVAALAAAPAHLVDLRFGVLIPTVLLGLVIGAIGIFGVARGQRSTEHLPPPSQQEAAARLREINELAEAEHAMAEGEATPAQEAKVIQDAAQRADEHRKVSWARVRRDEQER